MNLLQFCTFLCRISFVYGRPQILPVVGGAVSAGGDVWSQNTSTTNGKNALTEPALAGNLNASDSDLTRTRSVSFTANTFFFTGSSDYQLDMNQEVEYVGLAFALLDFQQVLMDAFAAPTPFPGSRIVIYRLGVRIELTWLGGPGPSWTNHKAWWCLREDSLLSGFPKRWRKELHPLSLDIAPSDSHNTPRLHLEVGKTLDLVTHKIDLGGLTLRVDFAGADGVLAAPARSLLALFRRRFSVEHWIHNFQYNGINAGMESAFYRGALANGTGIDENTVFEALSRVENLVNTQRGGSWTGFYACVYEGDVLNNELFVFSLFLKDFVGATSS